MKKIYKWFFSCLIIMFLINGCGGSKTPSDLSSTTGSTNNVAGTASLKISAKFPAAGSSGEIGKSMIDPNTKTIEIDVWGVDFNNYALLTKDKPTAVFNGLLPGEFNISIITKDANDNVLDYLYGKGILAEGDNTFTATLLRGNWKFVNATGAETTIALNKTLSTSQETIWGFSIAPYYYAGTSIKKGAIDKTKPWNFSSYPLLWRGSNFNTNAGANNEVYHRSYVYYVNQFIGPNTSNNAIDIDIEYSALPLTPSANFSNYSSFRDFMQTDRFAFIFGLPADFDIFGEQYQQAPGTFTQNGVDVSSGINSYANTKAVDGDTMTGTIVEAWEKSFNEGTMKCYTNASKTNEITCPMQVWSASIKKSSLKAIKNYLANAFKSGIKKSAVDANGCMRDVTNTWTDEWWSGYWDGPNFFQEYYVVIENVSVTFDACMHPFTAKASALDLPGSTSVSKAKKK